MEYWRVAELSLFYVDGLLRLLRAWDDCLQWISMPLHSRQASRTLLFSSQELGTSQCEAGGRMKGRRWRHKRDAISVPRNGARGWRWGACVRTGEESRRRPSRLELEVVSCSSPSVVPISCTEQLLSTWFLLKLVCGRQRVPSLSLALSRERQRQRKRIAHVKQQRPMQEEEGSRLVGRGCACKPGGAARRP